MQFWTAAVDEWKDHPLRGLGAGSFEQWWSEHASFTNFVRDAPLYLGPSASWVSSASSWWSCSSSSLRQVLTAGAGRDGDARVTAAAPAAFAGLHSPPASTG
jgi:hypothetical protein